MYKINYNGNCYFCENFDFITINNNNFILIKNQITNNYVYYREDYLCLSVMHKVILGNSKLLLTSTTELSIYQFTKKEIEDNQWLNITKEKAEILLEEKVKIEKAKLEEKKNNSKKFWKKIFTLGLTK